MKKLLILIINNFLIIILIQSPTWCNIWNQVEILLTPLNQTLPPIIKSSLSLTADLTLQVSGSIKQCLVQPLVTYLVFTLVKITYHVCYKTGYYNYNPVFIKQNGLLFQVYNAYEAAVYYIIRDFATTNPSVRYVITSFCIIFALRVTNFPLVLSIIVYFYFIYGWSDFHYLLDYETRYTRIIDRFKFKKLTFQRWEIIYNGGKLSPLAELYLLNLRTLSEKEGQRSVFWLAKWGDCRTPHYTNTHMRKSTDWDPSMDPVHSLSHSSKLVGEKVAHTSRGLLLPKAEYPGYYCPTQELKWVDTNKYKSINNFDLYLSFFTHYKKPNEFYTQLYNKWTFPATTALKRQNDLYHDKLVTLINEEGVDKTNMNDAFITAVIKAGFPE